MARETSAQKTANGMRYLEETGAGALVPRSYLQWLEPQTDHPSWDHFFGASDAEIAQRHREGMVREYFRGTKIKVVVPASVPTTADHIITKDDGSQAVEMPAWISVRSTRTHGGGYRPMDPNDPFLVRERREQAADKLREWMESYNDVLVMANIEPYPVHLIIGALQSPDQQEAAE